MAMDWNFLGKRGHKDNGVLKSSLTIGVSTILANAFTYFFYLYNAKVLGPEKYGVFGSLLSIYFIVFFLTNILNYITIQYVSYFKAKTQYEKIRRLFDVLVRIMTIAGFAIFLLLVALSGYLKGYIGDDSTGPIISLGLFLWAYIVLATVFGMLNGMQKFKSLGASRIMDGFFTMVFGVIFLSLGMGISGGMLALFFAALLTVPFALAPLKFIFSIHPARIGEVGMFEFIFRSLVPSIFVAIMLNCNVLVVKYFFNAIDAGYFAAASLMGNIVFFVSTGVLTVIFPKAAELHSNGEDTSPLLKDGLLYTAAIGFTVSLLYFSFPKFFAHLIFGPEYLIDNLVGVYALTVTFLALTNVFVMYNMAIKNYGVTYILVPFTILQISAMFVFHKSLEQLLWVVCLTMFLLCVGILYFSKDDFVKMFKKTSGYKTKYPITAYLRLKTEGASSIVPDEMSSSRKIKVKEIHDFMKYDDIDWGEDEKNKPQ